MVALSVLLLIPVRFIVPLNPTPIIIFAVAAGAWYGGTGPGIVAALLWSFLAHLFMTQAPIALQFQPSAGDPPRILVLVAIAILA